MYIVPRPWYSWINDDEEENDMETYDDHKVVDAVDAVWQSLTDKQLQELTQPLFDTITIAFGMTDEEQADAWYEFGERRMRVFP